MAERTKHGFRNGHLLCEATTNHSVRVINTRSGHVFDVYVTPKGRKSYCGTDRWTPEQVSNYLYASQGEE